MYDSWALAYLDQARSDWRIYQHLRDQVTGDLGDGAGAEPCHALHYLQMATEKLGKAYLLASGRTTPEGVARSHEAFAGFLVLIDRNEMLAALEGMSVGRLARHVADLTPLVRNIEKLAPAIAGSGPNPEYPWAEGGAIRVPARYVFEIEREMEGKGLRLQRMIDRVLAQFENLFDMQPAGN